MVTRVTDLHCKEVICISDGRRLGFICDVEVEIPSGNVLAIVVPGPGRLLGVIGPRDDYIIPWNCIKRIGGHRAGGREAGNLPQSPPRPL